MHMSRNNRNICMKIDSYYQRRRCSPDSGNIRFMRIFPGVPWRLFRGNQKRRFSGLSDATSSAP